MKCLCKFAHFFETKRWGDLSLEREESPDRTGHPAAESAAGGNLRQTVTEKNRPFAGKGENAGQEPTTCVSDAARVRTGTCKTKYIGRRGLPARCRGVGCEDK